MTRKARRSTRTKDERALEEIYAEIPSIPGCTGACAVACGPIAMFKGEWERVKRTAGREPRLAPGSLTCPMLSPTGRCMVYSVRPYICRLWGTTRALRCPEGCEPERWLTLEEAQGIYERIRAVAGPRVQGPLGSVEDLWDAIALPAREDRLTLMEQIGKVVEK